MNDSDPRYHLGTRNHLFIGEGLLIVGELFPKGERLVDHLNHCATHFVDIHAAELRAGEAVDQSERISLRIDAVSLAHEYVGLSGDPHLKQHAEPSTRPAQILLDSPPGVRIHGKLRPDQLEGAHRFLVLMEPTAVGLPSAAAKSLEGLPYLLVNRDRIQCILYPEGPAAPK